MYGIRTMRWSSCFISRCVYVHVCGMCVMCKWYVWCAVCFGGVLLLEVVCVSVIICEWYVIRVELCVCYAWYETVMCVGDACLVCHMLYVCHLCVYSMWRWCVCCV